MAKLFDTPKKKVILIVGVILVLLVSWYAISANSETRESRAFRAMPQGSIQVVNDLGNTVTLQLRVADTPAARQAGFKGSGVQTVANNAILLVYTADTAERHNVQNVKAPLEIGFFRADGSLIQISRTRVGATTTYGTTGTANRYRYAIMAPEGYFARNNISVDGGASLVTTSLRKR